MTKILLVEDNEAIILGLEYCLENTEKSACTRVHYMLKYSSCE